MHKVLGIDPGLNKTGWAIIEKGRDNSLKLIASGLIKTNPKDPISQRLLVIHEALNQLFQAHKIASAAIEETYVNTNFASSLKLSHARAAAILSCAIMGIHTQEYGAKTVKKNITGNGNAEKDQVGFMIQRIIPGSQNISQDINDAIAIAICHALLT